ncbi:MAG: CsbD family protein [Propionicimonas sp.]
MGIDDKVSNAAEGAVGKAKEVIGDLTGDEELEADGVKEQAAAKAKEIGERVHDFVEDVVADVKKAVD